MIIWNQDEIVISCFMNLSWQFRILILNEKLFSINSFAAWIFWCWKITRIRKKKPLEFCVWVCVSVCGSGAKICRKLLISYKKKIVLKNNRFLKIFVLQSPTSRTICSNHWKAKRSIKSQCPNFCWDEMSFQQKSRLIQLQMTNITTLLKVCCPLRHVLTGMRWCIWNIYDWKKTIGTNSKPLSRARVKVSNTWSVWQKSKFSLKAKNC